VSVFAQFESQPEEVMLVTGTPEQRSAAWKLVKELISAEEEERVPVPASQHRSIIGARGVSISQIERESGAHISFEVEPAEAMVVRGTTTQRKLAIELVSDVLAGEEEEQFYVEHRYHGYLIGPGGSRVREIEQATVTRVSCNDEEPVVVVYGSSKRRDAAWELIKAKMDEYDEDRSSGGTGA
jgi:polyribonucleotide nucleotidyltransferase